jgi:hypothetical protein
LCIMIQVVMTSWIALLQIWLSVPVAIEPAVITLHYRFLAWKSENDWGFAKTSSESTHHYRFMARTGNNKYGTITDGFWLKPAVINHSTKVVILSSLPSRAHSSRRRRFPHSLHCCGCSSPKYSMKLLDFQRGHDLLALRLVTSIHSFRFVVL